MAECSRCGEETSMPFQCKFCEQRFCAAHRLPENHDCDSLDSYTERSRAEGKIGYDVMKDSKTVDVTPGASSGRPRRGGGVLDRVDDYLPGQATPALIGVIAGVFLLQMAFPGLFNVFALVPDRVLTEPWRLATSIFLHGSLFHLLANGIVLYSFGSLLERMLDTNRFLEILFAGALASSIGFTAWHLLLGSGAAAAVGISGGLYAAVTFLAVVRPNVTVLAYFFIPLKIRTAVGIFAALDALNLLAGLAGQPFLPFASAGHLSGFLVGLWYGRRLKDQVRRPQPRSLFQHLGPG